MRPHALFFGSIVLLLVTSACQRPRCGDLRYDEDMRRCVCREPLTWDETSGMCVGPDAGAPPDGGECMPSPETCNGRDDDCDGTTDERPTECAGPNATTMCADGECRATCEAGYDDCTDAPGCETDVSEDRTNCGACGRTCEATQRCGGSSCAGVEASWVHQLRAPTPSWVTNVAAGNERVVVVGRHFGAPATFAGRDLATATSFIASLRDSGELEWVATLAAAAWLSFVAVDELGSTVFGGETTESLTLQGQTVAVRGASEGFVGVFSPDGALEWLAAAGSVGADSIRGGAIDQSGQLWVLGYAEEELSIDTRHFVDIRGHQFVARYRLDGHWLETRRLPFLDSRFETHLALAGGRVFVHTEISAPLVLDGVSETASYVLMSIGAGGAIEWVRENDSPTWDMVGRGNRLFACGSSGPGSVVVLDSSTGRLIAEHVVPGHEQSVVAVTLTDDGDLITLGLTRGEDVGTGPLRVRENEDTLVVRWRLDDWQPVWAFTMGGYGIDSSNIVKVDGSSLYTGGSFSGTMAIGASSYSASGPSDGLLVRFEL